MVGEEGVLRGGPDAPGGTGKGIGGAGMQEKKGPEKPKARPLELHPVEVEGRSLYLVRDPLEIMEGQALVPPDVAFLLQLMDGTRTPVELALRFALETGRTLPSSALEKLVEDLDKGLFLEGDRFEKAFRKVVEDFLASPVRPAALAGRSYPADKGELASTLEGILDLGPSDLAPLPAPPAGLVAPHIDLDRGKKTYALAYRHLQAAPPAETFVLFGTCHAGGLSPLIPTRKDFETPLGRVEVDQEFLDPLLAVLGEQARREEFLHRNEHSLEFQVLFLQALFPDRPFRIVPLLTGALSAGEDGTPRGREDVEAAIDVLAGEGRRREGRITFLAGADLAHLGPRFGGDRPLEKADLEDLARKDRATLETAAGGDPEAFYRDVAGDGNARNVCGLSPIYFLLRCLVGRKGEVLGYEQAAEEDGSQVVSFGALLFPDPF